MLKLKLTRMICLLTMVALLLSAMAGCVKPQENNNSDVTATSPENTTAQEQQELIKVDFLILNTAEDFYVKNIFKDKFNIEVTFNPMPSTSTFNDKLNLLIAANELPDIICPMTSSNATKLGPQGLLVPVDKYLDKMPNFAGYLRSDAPSQISITADDGHIYSLPSYYDVIVYKGMTHVRIDRFEELNLKIPTTVKEMIIALKTIKEKYPQSLGFVNQVGAAILHIDHFGSYYNISNDIYLNLQTNIWQYGPLYPAYKEMLIDMNTLNNEGLLDPDFFTANAKQFDEKFNTGNALWAIGFDSVYKGQMENYQKLYPEDKDCKFAPILPLTSDNNKQMGLAHNPNISVFTAWAVSSKTKSPERILKMADWLYTEEGMLAVKYGEKDIHYTVLPDGKFQPVEDVRKKYGLSQGQIMRTQDNSKAAFAKESEKEHQALLKSLKNDKNIDNHSTNRGINLIFTEAQNSEMDEITPDLRTYIDENSIKFVLGTRPLSEYDQFLKDIEKLGAKRLEEIYAESFKEYNEKLQKIK